MNETLEFYENMFSELATERQKVLKQAEEICLKEEKELSATKTLMLKYDLPFGNEKAKIKSVSGIIVGVRNGLPLVLHEGNVFIETADGKTQYDTAVTLKDFLFTADLATVNAGFEYVRKMRVAVENPIAKRTAELKLFISNFQGFNIKSLIE